jgi:DNA-binding response OmpR family regulator
MMTDHPGGQPMQILIVEDDARIAGFVTQGLEESGYHVTVARQVDTPLGQSLIHTVRGVGYTLRAP